MPRSSQKLLNYLVAVCFALDFQTLDASSSRSSSFSDSSRRSQHSFSLSDLSRLHHTSSDRQEEPTKYSPSSDEKSHAPSTHVDLGDLAKVIEIKEPSDDDYREFLRASYRPQTAEKMNEIVVGLKGQSNLMTLTEGLKDNAFSPEEAGAILRSTDDFKEGEIAAVKLMFGARRGEDIVIGRYPSHLIARPRGQEALVPGDPSLGPLTKWLEILGHMAYVTPVRRGGRIVFEPPPDGFKHDVSVERLAAKISLHHFSAARDLAVNTGFGLNTNGATLAGGFASDDVLGSGWISVMSGWLGVGYTGKFNIEENQMGLSAVGGGASVAGWKDYLQAGASISVITDSGNQFGLGGVMTLSKDRVTTYKHQYNGEYDALVKEYVSAYSERINSLENELIVTDKLIELKRALDNRSNADEVLTHEKERIRDEISALQENIATIAEHRSYLEGKHFIEVVDKESKGLRVQGGAYAGGVSLGFRFSYSKGQSSTHRFYADIDRAHELLKDGSGDKIALLRLPEEFDREDFPDLERPDLWQPGEEVVTNLTRTFSGSIVLGVGGIPGLESKIGLSHSVSGSFEFGVRKLPANKIEVTFKPQEITEMGGFVGLISTFGPQLSVASTVALAMRQTFVFDLNNQEAYDIYSRFLTGGVLPLNLSLSSGTVGAREAENLLDTAIIARDHLAAKGILLTYLEKIDVSAKKFYIGALKAPIVSSNKWAGLSYEELSTQAKVISTNGDFAVSRDIHGEEVTKGLGRSGFESERATATLKRRFTKEVVQDDDGDDVIIEDGYIWRFQSLVLQGVLSDTKVTRNEQNEMIDKLNHMFLADVSYFPAIKNLSHNQSREIVVERTITVSDMDHLDDGPKNIENAANLSGVDESSIVSLVKNLDLKGHDEKAAVIKDFVGHHGLKGMSAVHLLFEGDSRNLLIRTTSSAYTSPLQEASQLEALYTNPEYDPKKSKQRLLNISYATGRDEVRTIYRKIRSTIHALNQGLEDLYEDPLFVEQDDHRGYGASGLRSPKAELRTKLLAAKNRLLDLLDVDKQDFTDRTLASIFRRLRRSKRDLFQRYIILKERYNQPISVHNSKREVRRRWHSVTELLEDIKQARAEAETDRYQTVYGELYTQRRLEELSDLREATESLIDVSQVIPYAEEFIAKLKKKTIGMFSRPIYHEIAGVIAEAAKKTREDQ